LHIRRPLGVGPPFGALFHLSRLLRRWKVRVIGAPREEKLLGQHRGDAWETSRWRRRGGDWRLDREEWHHPSPIVLAHLLFTLCRCPRSPPCGLGTAWKR
jgi:hypothetical protein